MVSCNPAHAADGDLPLYRASTSVAPVQDRLPVPEVYTYGRPYRTVMPNGTVDPISNGMSLGRERSSPLVYGDRLLPDLVIDVPPTATTANPEAFHPRVNPAGAPVLVSDIPVSVRPPAGATVPGSVVPPASIVREVPLGSGTGSLAAKMGKSVLGVVAGAAAVLAAPEVAVLLATAQIGMIGYDFYKELNAQGVEIQPDGSFKKTLTSLIRYSMNGAGVDGQFFESGQAFCSASAASSVFNVWSGAKTGVYNSSANVCTVSSSVGNTSSFSPSVSSGCSAGYVQVVSYCKLVDSSAVPAYSNDQLALAVAAATASAAAAVDIANLYRKLDLSLPADMPVNPTPPYNFKSPYTGQGSTTDSTGNTTTRQSRNEVTAPSQTSTGTPINYTQHNVTNNITNGTTTTTTTTYVPPATPPAAVVTGGLPTTQKDLCLDHPEILACANIANVGDVPDTTPMLKKDINVAITPVVLPQNLICPAGVTHRSILGGTQYWDVWRPACNFAPMMKPVVLAFSWLAAGMIVFVGRPYQ